MNDGRCCETCRYWMESGSYEKTEGFLQIGWCHRHAPKPKIVGYETQWPSTKDIDFCGEWSKEDD